MAPAAASTRSIENFGVLLGGTACRPPHRGLGQSGAPSGGGPDLGVWGAAVGVPKSAATCKSGVPPGGKGHALVVVGTLPGVKGCHL